MTDAGKSKNGWRYMLPVVIPGKDETDRDG